MLPKTALSRRLLGAFTFLALVLALFFSIGPLLSEPKNSDPMIFGFGFSAEEKTIIILSVISGSPADEAGLVAGDRIIGIDNKPLSSELLEEPREAFAKMQKVTFLVDSGGRQKTVTLNKKRLSEITHGQRVQYAQAPLQMAGYRTGELVADMGPLYKNEKEATTLYRIEAKYKLISFWATWCKACRQKISAYTWARKRFSEKNLAIISVSLDETRSTEVLFAQEHNMQWYHYREPGSHGNQEFNTQWKIYSIPVAVLLGPDNKVIEIITSEKNLAEILESRL